MCAGASQPQQVSHTDLTPVLQRGWIRRMSTGLNMLNGSSTA